MSGFSGGHSYSPILLYHAPSVYAMGKVRKGVGMRGFLIVVLGLNSPKALETKKIKQRKLVLGYSASKML